MYKIQIFTVMFHIILQKINYYINIGLSYNTIYEL